MWIPRSRPQTFGGDDLVRTLQRNDGSHLTGHRWWMVWLQDGAPLHRCWCSIGQRPVSLQGFHRCSQMSNFSSQMSFIEKAFSPNILPDF
jgi:hypothetical protein